MTSSFVPIQKVTKVPLMHGEQRLIIATCEKGTVEDVNDMKDIKAGLDEIKAEAPELRGHRGAGSVPAGQSQERGRSDSEREASGTSRRKSAFR